jgi:hypothetical protein
MVLINDRACHPLATRDIQQINRQLAAGEFDRARQFFLDASEPHKDIDLECFLCATPVERQPVKVRWHRSGHTVRKMLSARTGWQIDFVSSSHQHHP